ncbi:MAG TPA: DUF3488 and transglutaminase-like domain-containing protein, partial [Acidimicrobiales bacterium]|nr:DUF3488 and transglutaminase-like domain-containing protein [Acidimicrobiales bacterium]
LGGWSDMLAAGLPADARGELLVTPLAIAWLAAGAAALLALHTHGPVIPVGPPAAALVVALALTGGARARPLTAGAFLVLALALMLVRANRVVASALAQVHAAAAGGAAPPRSPNATRLHTPAGRVAFGVPLVVGIAVASPLAAAALPPGRGDRFDPRDLRGERFEVDDALSPLVRLKAQLKADPPRELFRIEVDAGDGPRPDRVRTAALDAYDGTLWTATGDYRRAGHELPPDPLAGAGTVVRQRVTITGLDGPFLPAIGRPVELAADLDSAAVGFDAAAGTLVSARTDLAGVTYEVVSTVALPTDEELVAATASDDQALDALRATPPALPVELGELARTWTAGTSGRSAELVALRDKLREIRYDDSADAEPGHTYGALLRVLAGESAEREGYAEQFAAAYAVLARTRGFAARVATGYRLPEPGPDGVTTVTDADAHAWPEVHLDGLGWVAIEPTGERLDAAPEPEDVEAPPGQPGEQANDASQPSPPVPPSVVEAVLDGDQGNGAGLGAPAVVGGVAAFGAVAVLASVPAAAKRWRRRRRRRAGSTAAQVVGAWRETLDRLVELGAPVAPSLTPAEIAHATGRRFPQGAGPVGQLVPLVAAAVYAPVEPDGQAAERAWRLAREAGSQLRRSVGPAQRLRAAFDPRPLVPPGRRARRAAAGRVA